MTMFYRNRNAMYMRRGARRQLARLSVNRGPQLKVVTAGSGHRYGLLLDLVRFAFHILHSPLLPPPTGLTPLGAL
jgi:hypothetical protein